MIQQGLTKNSETLSQIYFYICFTTLNPEVV